MGLPERFVWALGPTLLLSLIPLAFAANSFGRGGWGNTIYNGELMLVAVIVTGPAVATASRVSPTHNSSRTLKAFLIVGGIGLLLFGSFFYADTRRVVADALQHNVARPSQTLIAVQSYVLLAFSTMFLIASTYLVHTEMIEVLAET
jgi:uncharacterized membrane protein YidH (DUF202 family)